MMLATTFAISYVSFLSVRWFAECRILKRRRVTSVGAFSIPTAFV
jgi:hypothetical protein